MPKIIHYRQKCIGCGVCYEMQPQAWRMSKKDGKATLLRAMEKKSLFILSIPETQTAPSQEVVLACPAKCIKVV